MVTTRGRRTAVQTTDRLLLSRDVASPQAVRQHTLACPSTPHTQDSTLNLQSTTTKASQAPIRSRPPPPPPASISSPKSPHLPQLSAVAMDSHPPQPCDRSHARSSRDSATAAIPMTITPLSKRQRHHPAEHAEHLLHSVDSATTVSPERPANLLPCMSNTRTTPTRAAPTAMTITISRRSPHGGDDPRAKDFGSLCTMMSGLTC